MAFLVYMSFQVASSGECSSFYDVPCSQDMRL
jgi:hypothetical protein